MYRRGAVIGKFSGKFLVNTKILHTKFGIKLHGHTSYIRYLKENNSRRDTNEDHIKLTFNK